PSASAAARPEPPTECTPAECAVTSITDKVKAELEAAKEKNADLKIVFKKGSTDEDLKTLSKIPWVTSLKLDSDKITTTFSLSNLKELKNLEIGPTSIASLAGITELTKLTHFEARDVD